MLSPRQNTEAEILALVNKARVALGMPPIRNLPRGIPVTSRKCVLGRSLDVEVLIDDQDQTYALLTNYRSAYKLARAWNVARPCGMWNGWAVLLSEELNRFVHEFDARCYPHLTSATSEAKNGVRSELRYLRFDWVDEHTRVADLIERARAACDQAEDARKWPQSSGTAAGIGSVSADLIPAGSYPGKDGSTPKCQ
jgi:hypothetical protein